MILNQQENESYPLTIACLQEKALENVSCYRYLGCEINTKEHTTGEAEINLRIDAAESKFYSITHNFLNMKINLKIRTTMLNALIRSRLVHGCQTWNVNQTQLKRVGTSYNKMLRKLVKGGYKRREGSWSFVHRNEDILRMAKTLPLESFVKNQQRNYVAHIIRKNNSSIVKKLIFNSNESRKQGPQQSLLSNVLKNEGCTLQELMINAVNRKF